MPTIDWRPLHLRAIELTGSVIDNIDTSDLGLATPCTGWDLRELLGHMIGQNHGFAEAVEAPADVAVDRFAARPPGHDLAADWLASADRVTGAFAAADPERPVLLPEISTEHRLPTWVVVGFHLVDTVAHGWDVATALGLPFRPDDELAAAALRQAELVPVGPVREQPGAAFAPPVPLADDSESDSGDDWLRTLALLGRTG